MDNKNKIYKIIILPAIVIVGLIVLYFLPEIKLWGDNPLRKVDIFSSLKKSEEEIQQEQMAHYRELRKAFRDSIPDGIYAIEDFGGDSLRMMDHFYAALAQADSLDRPVRVAFLGDSFIGGDCLTADLRELFQKEFGGMGVGAVNVKTSQAGCRPTLSHSTSGLKEYTVVSKSGFNPQWQGMNNEYSVLEENSGTVTLKGTQTQFGTTVDRWTVSSLYFLPVGGATVSAQIDGGKLTQLYSGKSEKVEKVQIKGNTTKVSWSLSGKGSYFYLAANETERGVMVDNFSLVASPGTSLANIPQKRLDDFAAVRPYDLIIISYGLNIVSPGQTKFDNPMRMFSEAIQHFRKAWPNAAILVVSVSDRGSKSANGVTSMKGIAECAMAQREMASQSHVAFWNMYDMIVQEGGIGKFAENGEVSKDYVHITFKGGKHIATKLYEALKVGYDNYLRRSKLDKMCGN